MKKSRIALGIALLSAGLAATFVWFGGWSYLRPKLFQQTTESVLANIGAESRAFWQERGDYPPKTVTLIAIKNSDRLEVWNDGSNQLKIAEFPILAASGDLGPKLREGDKQVPEGIYDITALNPNSSFHLSMRVDYPNNEDLKNAEKEGRVNPGSDIFIHGEHVSIGCLAMGNPAIEKLFTLVADVGVENVRVIIAPVDFRTVEYEAPADSPEWLLNRYSRMKLQLQNYRNRPQIR